MKSRLNFIKSLAAGLFGGAALLSSNTAKAATSEATSTEEKLADLSKKVKELEDIKNDALFTEGCIGEIRLFGGNFAPRNWALCEGQLLAISQHSALFSILGTIYGGDGRTTFALPDLRGRTAIGPGSGPGLSNIRLGSRYGTETNTPLTGTAAGPGRSGNVSVDRSNGQSVNNMQPSLGINYVICLNGIFPSRS